MVSKSPQISEYSWSFFTNLIFCLTGTENEIKNFTSSNICNQINQGIGIEFIDKICVILMNFIIRDSNYFINGKDIAGVKFIDRIMFLIERLVLISSTKKTEFESCNAIKIIIVMLDSLKGNIDFLFEKIIVFIINQLKISRTEYYKAVLINSVN